jgi:2-polyprenyl-6-methoxyphenol hydroxylase-like FAD-dependent oxidoreductase
LSVARDKTKGAQDPRVVIVGAGPAGLALAIELGTRSIPCLLIEKNERAGHSPRAKTTNIRTREHLRRWGIARELAAASPFGVDYPVNILFVTRLSGHHIARFENALGCSPVRDNRYSEHSQWIPQYKLEAVLLEHARSLDSVDIQFSQEFLDFEQDGEGVRVRVRDAARGTDRVIVTKYLVGADGSHSVVRDRIGATMLGTFGLSRNYNAVFRAPGLAQAHSHGPGIMYWQINKDVPGLIGPMDQGDLWYFMPTGVPSGVTYSEDETCELIRKSTGIDLPYQVLSSDIWVASRLLADRYAVGRVFLTGDACHLHPPFGGYGMNMGIADSVDLGWKLAAVLQGWGGAALLDSYETERRPAHKYVMDEAEANHALSPNSLVREGIEDANEHGASVRSAVADLIWQHKTAEFFSLGVVLGLCYRDSPIIATEPAQAEWKPSRDYVPSAAPGCLAPHWWLADGKSIYDLFGLGFTLLIFDARVADQAHSARREAEHTGTPLQIVTVLDDSLVELYGAPLALIRPDQHVAWRGDAWPAVGLLGLVCGRRPQAVLRSGYAGVS